MKKLLYRILQIIFIIVIIFSTYKIEVEDYYITTKFINDDEYIKFLNKVKSRSNHDYNVELDKDDQILTLSTCSGNNKRIVVHAKKVSEE